MTTGFEYFCGLGLNIFGERLTILPLSACVLPTETAIHVVGRAPFPTVCLCPAALASNCKLWDTFGFQKPARFCFNGLQSLYPNDQTWIFGIPKIQDSTDSVFTVVSLVVASE